MSLHNYKPTIPGILYFPQELSDVHGLCSALVQASVKCVKHKLLKLHDVWQILRSSKTWFLQGKT